MSGNFKNDGFYIQYDETNYEEAINKLKINHKYVRIPTSKGKGDFCDSIKQMATTMKSMYDETHELIVETILMLEKIGIALESADKKSAASITKEK